MPASRRYWTKFTTLLIDLDATEDQLEFPLLYAVGRTASPSRSLEDRRDNLHLLFDTIIEIHPRSVLPRSALQMLVSDLGYSDYLGRLAVGKVFNGTARSRDQPWCVSARMAAPFP
jgi:GTP-binding protein